MAILFHPHPGTILLCDYTGLKEPEMVKRRPVVIVAPRSRHHELVTVVPISTTPPRVVLPWHVPLTLAKPLSPVWPELTVWVKGDLLNSFSSKRLDRFHARLGDQRKYYGRHVCAEDLQAIRKAIATYLSL